MGLKVSRPIYKIQGGTNNKVASFAKVKVKPVRRVKSPARIRPSDFSMVSRVLFSSRFYFQANPPFQTRETSITLSRNASSSFSFKSPVDRLALRIKPLVRTATFAPIVAEVDVSRDGIRRKKLAVFVSGGGSNFKKIHEGCSVGSINGDVVLLVTNKNDCGGAEYAINNGIPVLVFPKGKQEPSDGLSSMELVDVLRKYGVDFVLLAGYLKLIPVELVQAFPKRILNIHPALLPAFGGKGLYGERVHKAVLASGARYSGPTIHFVDEEYDTGRILAQSAVRVNANDTAEELAKRVLHEEHKLYVEVVAALCEDRIKWREDGVPLIQSKENSDVYY